MLNKKNRLRIFLVGAMGFVSTICFGGELNVNGSFAKFDKSGLPVGWFQNRWKGYQPLGKIKTIAGENSGEHGVLLYDNKGKYGSCIMTHKKFQIKAGDKITIILNVKGKGVAEVGFHGYSADKRFTGLVQTKSFTLTEKWKTQQIEIVVSNSKKSPTGNCVIALVAKHGAEFAISDLKVFHESSPYIGILDLPREWLVFVPGKKDFTPTARQLLILPKSFGGVKPVKARLAGDTLDFAPIFGGQQEKNCGWAFAELEAPFDCEYTIGAAADWWMEYYVNGEKVIDTMNSGNNAYPYQINNHLAVVKLKKGRNVLAVKLVTGKSSSILMLGGPNELRDLRSKLNISKKDCLDDYDKPGKRTGKHEIIQDYPSPGINAYTGQGAFHPAPKTSTFFPNKRFSLPKNIGDKLFATGFRLQSFGRHNRVDSSINIDIELAKTDGSQFSLRFDHRSKSDTLSASIQETIANKTTVIKQLLLPYSILPANVIVAVNQGAYVVNISSLADSSFRCITGESALLKRFGDRAIKTTLVFRSATKNTAEIVIDNYFIGQAGAQVKSSRIPFKIERAATFNPVKAGWKLVFNDEFDGTVVNRNKWFDYNSKNHLKEFASLDGKGNLLIKADYGLDGKTLKTAALWSKKTFSYGYFESRFRVTKQPGWWAAFWLVSQTVGSPVLDGFEIDIFEDYYTRPQAKHAPSEGILDHNLHVYNGNLLKSWNYKSKLPNGLDQFYTLGVKRTPFEISYYLNGKLIKSSANHSPYDSVTFDAFNHAFTPTPLHAIVSGQLYHDSNAFSHIPSNGTFPEFFKVDYVRVYEYPAGLTPKVTWIKVPQHEIVEPGEQIVMEASVKPATKNGAKILRAYLFDNGCLIDYKDKAPYRFDFAIDKAHYDNTPFMAAGRSGKKPVLDGFGHAFCIVVQDQNGKVGYSPVHIVIPAKPGNKPYQGQPQAIPGTLKIGNYDEGGNNVAYYDKTTKNSASNSFRSNEGVDCTVTSVGFVGTGEWIKYSVDIKASGKYDISLPYGSPQYASRRGIRLLVDGRFVCELDLLKRTSGWTITGAKAELKGVMLPAGRHTLTLVMIGSFNFGDLEFKISELTQ
jgi:hypothetical protein